MNLKDNKKILQKRTNKSVEEMKDSLTGKKL